MRSRKKAPEVVPPFRFPEGAHRRQHGPKGHISYRAYKPWLRDEFEFRCVYCLTRESWSSDGHNRFSIDHVKPKSSHRKMTCFYDNLVYACIRCNTLKSTEPGLPDPGVEGIGNHLRLLPNGLFVGQTPSGKRLVERLMLNSQERVMDRTVYLYLYSRRTQHPQEVLRFRFGYPSDLPDLSKLKPPKGNQRPDGVTRSCYSQRQAGMLPEYY